MIDTGGRYIRHMRLIYTEWERAARVGSRTTVLELKHTLAEQVYFYPYPLTQSSQTPSESHHYPRDFVVVA